MEQTLITASPNISGNIGSCKTDVVEADIGRDSVWKIQTMTLATNSCTGQVDKWTSYRYSDVVHITGIGFVVFFVIALFVFVVKVGDL